MVDADRAPARPHGPRARRRAGRHRLPRRRADPARRDADHLRLLARDARRRAQRRAEALGIENVRFRQIDAQRADRPAEAASIDGVLCRWGSCSSNDPRGRAARDAADPAPGGRVALAAWTAPRGEPVDAPSRRAPCERRGVARPARPGAPGQIDLGRPGRDRRAPGGRRLRRAARSSAVEFTMRFADVDEWWVADTLDAGARARMASALDVRHPQRRPGRARSRRPRRTRRPDGGPRASPPRTWVATATA